MTTINAIQRAVLFILVAVPIKIILQCVGWIYEWIYQTWFEWNEVCDESDKQEVK